MSHVTSYCSNCMYIRICCLIPVFHSLRRPRRLMSITSRKSLDHTVPLFHFGVCSYEPALSQYRVWEWTEDRRWQMLNTVLAEVAPVEIVVNSAAMFPGKSTPAVPSMIVGGGSRFFSSALIPLFFDRQSCLPALEGLWMLCVDCPVRWPCHSARVAVPVVFAHAAVTVASTKCVYRPYYHQTVVLLSQSGHLKYCSRKLVSHSETFRSSSTQELHHHSLRASVVLALLAARLLVLKPISLHWDFQLLAPLLTLCCWCVLAHLRFGRWEVLFPCMW